MENIKLVCKSCGKDSFITGQVGGNNSHGNLRPIGSMMAFESPFLMILRRGIQIIFIC